MAKTLAATRTVRFVCISDTHNSSPGGAFKLPKGDILIHAGDITNQGSLSELKKSIKWLEDTDFEAKIIIAGNHDITLDTEFYSQNGLYFHNQNPQDPVACQALLKESSVTYLNHEAIVVSLSSPSGLVTKLKIFGSPFSPAKGMWAFGYEREEAFQIWDCIPRDCDVVVTHTPPKFHCDETAERHAAGCEELRRALWRVRPRLAVCGHVHSGRGAERVRWDLSASNIKFKEQQVVFWDDPGRNNKKISLIDLTSRGGNAIKNDGAAGDDTSSFVSKHTIAPSFLPVADEDTGTANYQKRQMSSAKISVSGVTETHFAPANKETSLATRGQGGIPPSQRCDLETLFGRMGRQETCIVNAAIMESRWPHTSGGKIFRKPIVVDLDLPSFYE